MEKKVKVVEMKERNKMLVVMKNVMLVDTRERNEGERGEPAIDRGKGHDGDRYEGEE